MTATGAGARPHPITPALLPLAYAQLEILSLMCAGVPRDQAVTTAWELFYQHLAPLAPEADVVQEWVAGLRTAYKGRYPKPRYWCLAASAGRNARILRAGHDPARLLRPGQAATLAWLLEATRRMADGQPLLRAARSAHDAHQGKPRQRRQPVSRDWLDEQAAEALDDLWAQIDAAARQGTLRHPAWVGANNRPGGDAVSPSSSDEGR